MNLFSVTHFINLFNVVHCTGLYNIIRIHVCRYIMSVTYKRTYFKTPNFFLFVSFLSFFLFFFFFFFLRGGWGNRVRYVMLEAEQMWKCRSCIHRLLVLVVHISTIRFYLSFIHPSVGSVCRLQNPAVGYRRHKKESPPLWLQSYTGPSVLSYRPEHRFTWLTCYQNATFLISAFPVHSTSFFFQFHSSIKWRET